MEKNFDSKEKQLYKEYASKVNDILSKEDAKNIYDSLSHGRNSYMRVDRIESSAFDLSWIEAIESCIPDLGDIVNNPRLTTKVTEDLTPVELARKTNADSVKHLASHTQYIKEITSEGDVIPSKVLNIGSDDEVKTYENKFIATLIRMLVLFVEKRYEFVKDFAILHDHEMLYFKNKSQVNGADVEIETKVKVVSMKTDPVSLKNNEYIARIEQMRQFILYYYNSRFMKLFRTEKNVRNPILQTNIIRKNPKYHHCYELYRFIEAYDRLGVFYKVDEQFSQFNTQELSELNCLMFANYLALQGKDKSSLTKEKLRNYKPKIITSSDDEEFVYGPLLRGPIKFVRVDEAYQRYLDSKVDKTIPEELNEIEKKYYSQEIDVKKLTREEYEEKVKLLERKKWQQIQFDKIVLARIKEREKEEEELRKKRMEARLKEEEEYLATFRQRLVDEALAFHPHIEEEKNPDNMKTASLYPQKDNSLAFDKRMEPLTAEEMNQWRKQQDDLERELALQQQRLEHDARQSEKSQSASSLPKEERLEAALKSKPVTAKPSIDLKVPTVLPVLPTTKNDLLTAGLGNEDITEGKELHPNVPVDEKDILSTDNTLSSPTKEEGRTHNIPTPLPLPIDYDDPNRLTSDEKKAVLVYNLFNGSKPSFATASTSNRPVRPVSSYPTNRVPFEEKEEEDDYAIDPFERIRVLNAAYKKYDEEEGPFYFYPGLLEGDLTSDLSGYHLEDETSNKDLLLGNLLERKEQFVVETRLGYLSKEEEEGYTSDISKAYVFDDLGLANTKASQIHGKVITR